MTLPLLPHDELFAAVETHEDIARRIAMGQHRSGFGRDKLDYREKTIEGAVFVERTLLSAILVRCRFKNCTFKASNLSGALLVDSTFENCQFLDCYLNSVDLRGAFCVGNDFSGSDFQKADLHQANLAHANLSNCNFGAAWLGYVDLRFANLEGIDFSYAQINNAKIYNIKKFHFKSVEKFEILDVYTGFSGGGDKLSGDEALAYLMHPQE